MSMKKRLLALVSVAMFASCSFAFADSSIGNATDNASNTTTQETTKIQKSAKNATSCTDETGTVFQKGEPGFKTCWKHHMKQKQESGQAALKKQENNLKNNTNQAEKNANEGTNY